MAKRIDLQEYSVLSVSLLDGEVVVIKNQIMLWGAVASILGLVMLFVGNDNSRLNEGADTNKEVTRDTSHQLTENLGNDSPKSSTKEQLEFDFNVARQIRFSPKRDNAITEIVKESIRTEQYELISLSVNFASAINFSPKRDKVLELIIDKSIFHGYKDIALRAIDNITFSPKADKARQKIIQK